MDNPCYGAYTPSVDSITGAGILEILGILGILGSCKSPIDTAFLGPIYNLSGRL